MYSAVKMLFHPSASVAALNIRFCCQLKSSLLSFAHVQQHGTKSIHFLSFQKVFNEKDKFSCPELVFTRNVRRYRDRKRTDPPTDFLPFSWERGTKFCYIEGGGDNIRTLDVDPKICKWDLELTEVLEGLDDSVRKQFSLETMKKEDLLRINRQLLLKKVQQHPMDFDSKEVKIALKTLQVRSLFHHYTTMPRREKRGKVNLIQTIQKRNKMLKELRAIDLPRFEWLVKELDIDYTPTLSGFIPIRYTRKNELRRLTKEYCEKMVSEKRAECHAKLKEQQELFLKEKQEILEWIAKEEKDLGITENDNVPVP